LTHQTLTQAHIAGINLGGINLAQLIVDAKAGKLSAAQLATIQQNLKALPAEKKKEVLDQLPEGAPPFRNSTLVSPG